MAKIFLPTGFISAFSNFKDAVPTLVQIVQEIENAFNGQLSDVNIQPGSLTIASMADGVGMTASGQYTGTGVADRTIVLPFTPRYVLVLSNSASIEFTAMGSGVGPYSAYHRTSTGALVGDGTGNADWQGITSGGFLLGHAANGGLSNVSAQTFTYVAWK